MDEPQISTAEGEAAKQATVRPASGIARWPTALLLHLFERCQKDTDAQFEPNPIIVPISQTCAAWRRVAIANSSLWAKVYLTFRKLDMAMAFIERARGHDLSVYISSERMKLGEKDMSRFSDALTESLDTWREVTIHEDSHRRMALLLYALFCMRWPIALRKFTLKQTSAKPLKSKYVACLANFFGVGAGRQVTECKIWKCPVTWIYFRVKSLTILDIRHVSKEFFPAWTGFTEIIKAAVYLQHLVLIDVEFDLQRYRMPYPHLYLPHLESLTIRLYNESDIVGISPTFLKAIRVAPQLATLVISDIHEFDHFAEAAFASNERFPELTSLSLLYTGLAREVPDEFFEATKNLKTIRVVKWRGGYERMFDKAQKNNAWPQLQRIVTLKGRLTFTEEKQSISTLVESRKAAGQVVEFVSVEQSSLWSDINESYPGSFRLDRPDELYVNTSGGPTRELIDVTAWSDSESEGSLDDE